MLKFGNKEFRNLEEQVLKNQDNIESLQNKANISNLGINIITAIPLETTNELPLPYDGKYGDGFLVGTISPYELYIWTREDNEYNGEWFNWGPLNAPSVIPGPIGPQGIPGEPGTRGSLWNSQSGAPTQVIGVNNGDQALDGITGFVYQFNNGVWRMTGSIKGPEGKQGKQGIPGIQGPIGPKGDQGEPGPVAQFIKILGYLDSSDQLPDPNTVERTAAYLISVSGKDHIFLIIGQGTTEDPLKWHDAGDFTGGTSIVIDGTPQSSLDLTNAPIAPNYNTIPSSSASIEDNFVVFNNLEVTGKNAIGGTISPTQAKIGLPIKNSVNIEPKIVDNKLAFDITERFMNTIEDKIAGAHPSEVIINAPITATNGQLTEEQLSILQENTGAYILFNNEIYRLEDSQHIAGYLIYSHIGYENTANNYLIKCITITINTRGWVLTVRTVVNGEDYLPLNGGGTITGKTDTPLYLKSSENDAYIGFRNVDSVRLGFLGINADKKPVFNDDTTDYRLLLENDAVLLTGDQTKSGRLTLTEPLYALNYYTSHNQPAIVWDKPGSRRTGVGSKEGQQNKIWFGAVEESSNEWDDTTLQNWEFNGQVIARDFIINNAIQPTSRYKLDAIDLNTIKITSLCSVRQSCTNIPVKRDGYLICICWDMPADFPPSAYCSQIFVSEGNDLFTRTNLSNEGDNWTDWVRQTSPKMSLSGNTLTIEN